MLIPAIPLGNVFEISTHYLYLGLTLFVFFAAHFIKHDGKKKIPFLLLFLLWFFAVTRDWVGRDYEAYYEIFRTATWGGYSQAYTSIEPGFYYLNAFLNSICPYEYFGFMFFHFAILFLTYRCITYFGPNISFPYALLAYMAAWYFLSFSLLRICIAASIISYSIHFLLEKMYKKFFLLILLTFCIHMSSIVMIIPGVAYILYQKRPLMVFIGFGLILVIINSSVGNLLNQYMSIERYQGYLKMEEGTGIGFNLFFTYLPFIYWLWIGKKYVPMQLWELSLVFTLFAFIIQFSGYRITVMGRMQAYAIVPFLIYLPSLIAYLRRYAPKRKYISNSIAIFIYLMIKYYFFLPQLYWSDDIMPYKSLIF